MTPIIIQQTAQQAELAFELHTHAEIQSVRLRKARMASVALVEAKSGSIELRLGRTAKRVEAPEGILRLEIGLRVEGRTEAEARKSGPRKNGQPFVVVDCAWEVDYRLAEGYQPTAKTIKAFKDGNAIFNCWPYFREFVQSAIARMNLPPLTLPLLRLVPKPPAKKAAKSNRESHSLIPTSK